MSDDTPTVQHAVRAVLGIGRGGIRRRRPVPAALPPLERYLREWQSERLARTHADLVNSPEYGTATRFFLNDIYAPKDFSQRDADLLALYDFFRKFMPAPALRVLQNTVVLNDLTHKLENEMVAQLSALGCVDSFTEEQYEAAYRHGSYDERVRQIDLIIAVGRDLARLGRLPFIAPTVRAARGPAERLGWGELHDFLERGYLAWRKMPNPDLFLNRIETREKAILDRIFRKA